MTSWCKPENLASPQGYLFSTKTEVALAGLRVSSDEARRWFEKGWLSFSVDEVLELELPRDEELRFVASLARSGLNDALIDLLLAPLSRPISTVETSLHIVSPRVGSHHPSCRILLRLLINMFMNG